MPMVTADFSSPKQNHFLVALSTTDFDRLLPDLKLVPMLLGKVIYESGVLLSHIYPYYDRRARESEALARSPR